MVSEALAAHPSYVQGRAHARQFVLGTTLAARQAGLAGLGLASQPLAIADRVVDCEDWGPRVVGLQAAATFHAHQGEGATAAAIAVVVCELFEAASEKAPPEIRLIARRAITSVATDFAYGVLATPFPYDAIGWADTMTARLRGWGETDAALTLETLAAEALYDDDKIDAAIARLPAVGPSDDAGRTRHDRLKTLLAALKPDAVPVSPTKKFNDALAQLRLLYAKTADSPGMSKVRDQIGAVLAREEAQGTPETASAAEDRAARLFILLGEVRDDA